MPDILRTNELENAIDYLEKAAYHFNNKEDKYWFKWLMISLHGALYGFGVCAIKSINNERVLKKFSKKKFKQKKEELIDYYKELGFEIDSNSSILDNSVWYNFSELLRIWEILKHCQNEYYMNQRQDSKPLHLTVNQQTAIKKMIGYRNDFIHYKPALSAITVGEDWIVINVKSRMYIFARFRMYIFDTCTLLPPQPS